MTPWYRIGIGQWVSALWVKRLDTQPPAEILAVPAFSQRDPRWAGVRLGTSNVTIGQQGCLLTCHAMVAKGFGKDTDPARMNAWMTANGGYSSGNLWNWNAMNQMYPDILMSAWVDCLNTPAPLSQIDAALSRGEPCVVWVDFNPATAVVDMHWVLIIGKLADDDYVMVDSWDGWQGSFKSRYKDASRYIFRIVSYKKG